MEEDNLKLTLRLPEGLKPRLRALAASRTAAMVGSVNMSDLAIAALETMLDEAEAGGLDAPCST